MTIVNKKLFCQSCKTTELKWPYRIWCKNCSSIESIKRKDGVKPRPIRRVRQKKVTEKGIRLCITNGCNVNISKTHGATLYCRKCMAQRIKDAETKHLAKLRAITAERKGVKPEPKPKPVFRCFICGCVLSGRRTKYCYEHADIGAKIQAKLMVKTEPFIVYRDTSWWKKEDKEIEGYYPETEKVDQNDVVRSKGYAKADDKM